MKKTIIQHFRVIALCALSLSVLSPLASAQKFEVTEVKQIPVSVEAYHPVFVPGDNQLLVSEEDYYGLGVINLKDNSYKFLVEGRGAGYIAGPRAHRDERAGPCGRALDAAANHRRDG